MLHMFLILFLKLELSPSIFGLISHFETHPSDYITKEGGNATFSCTVLNFDPKTEILTWHVTPDIYPTVITEYYEESSHNITSVVDVYDVGRTQQLFQCVLRGLYDDFVFGSYSSPISTMHVHYFPRQDEIDCGPKSSDEHMHSEGTILSIWCVVQQGNPLVNLSWKLDGSKRLNVSHSEEHLKTQGEKIILNHELFLGPSLHAKTVYCIASSATTVFVDKRISCAIGPLFVRHKSRVVIYPTGLFDPYSAESQLELTCIATSYPEEKSYSWNCLPSNVLVGCSNATSRNVLLKTVSDASLSLVDVKISCSVTNAEGTSKADFILSPRRDLETDSNITDVATGTAELLFLNESSCQNISLELKLINQTLNSDSFETTLVCILNGFQDSSPTNPHFAWFVNEREMTHDSHLAGNSSSAAFSYLKIEALFKDYSIVNVSCEISHLSINDTLKGSMVLTILNTTDAYERHIHVTVNGLSKENTSQAHDSDHDFNQTKIKTQNDENKIGTSDDTSWLKLNGREFIIFTAVLIFGGLFLLACFCAFCTVLFFKYFKIIKPHGQSSNDTNCPSLSASQKKECLSQKTLNSDEISSVSDIFYEKPTRSPQLASIVMVRKHSQDKVGRQDNLIISWGTSRDSSDSYESSLSCSSQKSSNLCSDVSVPSVYSDWIQDTYSDLDLNNITCANVEYEYDYTEYQVV